MSAIPTRRSSLSSYLAGWLIAGLLMALFGMAACSDEGGGSAQALVCLSYGDEGRVVEAAVLRGLAEAGSVPGTVKIDGRDLTPAQWYESNPERFAEACAIVLSANQLAAGSSGGSSGGSVWNVLWPLIVGAVLTLVTTFATTGWRERMVEARRRSTALRTAAAQYASVVDDFLGTATDSRQREPSGVALDDPRRALQRVLDEMPQQGGLPAVAVAVVHRLLETGVLGRELAGGWSAREHRSPNGARAVAVRAGLAELRSAVNEITAAQERPLRAAVGSVVGRVRGRLRPRTAGGSPSGPGSGPSSPLGSASDVR